MKKALLVLFMALSLASCATSGSGDDDDTTSNGSSSCSHSVSYFKVVKNTSNHMAYVYTVCKSCGYTKLYDSYHYSN